jgi:hypothetical protein
MMLASTLAVLGACAAASMMDWSARLILWVGVPLYFDVALYRVSPGRVGWKLVHMKRLLERESGPEDGEWIDRRLIRRLAIEAKKLVRLQRRWDNRFPVLRGLDGAIARQRLANSIAGLADALGKEPPPAFMDAPTIGTPPV